MLFLPTSKHKEYYAPEATTPTPLWNRLDPDESASKLSPSSRRQRGSTPAQAERGAGGVRGVDVGVCRSQRRCTRTTTEIGSEDLLQADTSVPPYTSSIVATAFDTLEPIYLCLESRRPGTPCDARNLTSHQAHVIERGRTYLNEPRVANVVTVDEDDIKACIVLAW